MAWSRLEKVGTIYSRVRGLIRSGAMKEEDKPIWYDLYERFPPLEEPRFDRPAKDVPIRKIFYPEDVVRAKFQKLYGSQVRENLADHKTPTKCQQFIKTYNSLKNKGIYSEEEIFDKTAEELGLKINLHKVGTGETGRGVGLKVKGELHKETIVSSFQKAKEKHDKEIPISSEVNIKDIFKES